jgi:hypothetical protein
VRHAESRCDLHINTAEQVGFHRVREMVGNEESVAIARRHFRDVDVESVFAVRAVRRFNGDGVSAVESLVPDGGIDSAGFESFRENRLVLG